MVKVTNHGDRELTDIALSHLMPVGWEIHNARFDGDGPRSAEFDYQDVRDDRVLTYFGLKPGESRSFTTLATATYLGRYYLPGVAVESMYDHSYEAREVGRWVEVTARKQ